MDSLAQTSEAAPDPSEPEPSADAISDELEIEIFFRDHRGDSRQGSVISKISSKVEESRRVGMAFSHLTGGVPVSVLPEPESSYLYQYAWLSVAIPVRPDWFSEACERDGLLVAAVYGEVMAHRAKFLPDAGDDASGPGGTGAPRVRVTSALSRADTDGTPG